MCGSVYWRVDVARDRGDTLPGMRVSSPSLIPRHLHSSSYSSEFHVTSPHRLAASWEHYTHVALLLLSFLSCKEVLLLLVVLTTHPAASTSYCSHRRHHHHRSSGSRPLLCSHPCFSLPKVLSRGYRVCCLPPILLVFSFFYILLLFFFCSLSLHHSLIIFSCSCSSSWFSYLSTLLLSSSSYSSSSYLFFFPSFLF